MTIGRGDRALGACAAVLLVVLGVAGCATPGPGPAAGSHAAPAAAGWTSGERAKQDLKRGAASAGIAPIPAASVGIYMDVQESKLRQQLTGSGISVVRDGDEITLSVPDSVAFGSEGTDLGAAFGTVLDGLAAVLRKYDKTVIEVAGHTDASASHEQNQAASARRAAAIADALRRRGIAKSRITSVGAAEARPLANNDSTEGRARNRRIELTLSPLAQPGA